MSTDHAQAQMLQLSRGLFGAPSDRQKASDHPQFNGKQDRERGRPD